MEAFCESITITGTTIDHGREDEREDKSQGCSIPDSRLDYTARTLPAKSGCGKSRCDLLLLMQCTCLTSVVVFFF